MISLLKPDSVYHPFSKSESEMSSLFLSGSQLIHAGGLLSKLTVIADNYNGKFFYKDGEERGTTCIFALPAEV